MNLVKIPPHIIWLNSTLAYIEKMILVNPKLKPLYERIKEKGTVLGIQPENQEEVSLLTGMNLVFTVNTAQEVAIDMNETFIKKIQNLEEKSFNPPFDDMIFTVLLDGMYQDWFLQLFRMEECYIDPLTGKDHPVYCIKRMVHEKAKTFGMPSEYKAMVEMIVIPSKLPRVIFPSYIAEVCRVCKDVTETNIMDRVGKHIPGVINCLKTPRTMHQCVSGYAERGFRNLSFIIQILEKLTNSPKRIERIARIAHIAEEVRIGTKISKIIPEERRYIEIKDNSYFYRGPTRTRQSSGTHASPCEHLRRESTRTLKNGRVVRVKSSIVNKGGKKPIYIIKGDGE